MDSDHSILPWLGRTAKQMGLTVNAMLQLSEIDLTKDQWVLLKKLHEFEELSQQELAELTYRDKTSLARMLSVLERKGLIIRKTSTNDRRVKKVALSKYGESTFIRSIPYFHRINEAAMLGISEEELTSAISLVKKIHDNISNLHTDIIQESTKQ